MLCYNIINSKAKLSPFVLNPEIDLGEEEKRSVTDLLVDQEQLLAGKAFWQTLNDPFPAWEEL
ncbi:hypothetical protein SAMN04487868_103183 [Marinobacter salarius]|mgnify:FL=1|jgi:hypothetical protein|uniref:Uncharacterized protein n=1 Tax=Marinobacter salarius TaxID=1420917 RepID=A0ABY1FKV6_9GAMM|nr:hypothetical protein SAMN04487868_103183 [Marinobacter salarius]|tara:strand:- start:98 stop:286 length:189 start_codon:yes stop_codon:yes gene_type:complete